MAYTQAEIDAAELKMNNAKGVMQNWYSTMSANLGYLQKCVCGRKGVGCGSGCDGPYKPEKMPVLGETADEPCKNTTGAGKCCTDCCDVSTCEGKRGAYNTSVTNYDKAVDEYEAAKDYYETIKGDKKQGEVDTGVAKLEQEAKAIRTRYIIFGVIVLALIGVAVFFIFKSKK